MSIYNCYQLLIVLSVVSFVEFYDMNTIHVLSKLLLIDNLKL